jgi:hypothetical protein
MRAVRPPGMIAVYGMDVLATLPTLRNVQRACDATRTRGAAEWGAWCR